MNDRTEWERDALAWLVGRWIEHHGSAVTSAPRLARASAAFDLWKTEQDRALEAVRFAQRVTGRITLPGRGIRRVDHAPESARTGIAGPLALAVAAARGTHAAPFAELGVAAGSGRELLDEPCDTWVALPEDLPPGRYLALRVVGDSMVPLLHSGDVVLVDLDRPAHPGEVAVARHPEHGYVVKRLARGAGTGALALISLNSAYPPLEFAAVPGALLGPVLLRWCSHGPAKPGVAPRT